MSHATHANAALTPRARLRLEVDHRVERAGERVVVAEPLLTRGVTWNDSLFGRRGVYTVYLGGARFVDLAAAGRIEERTVTVGIQNRVSAVIVDGLAPGAMPDPVPKARPSTDIGTPWLPTAVPAVCVPWPAPHCPVFLSTSSGSSSPSRTRRTRRRST